MMRFVMILTAVLVAATGIRGSDQIPGAVSDRPIALVGGTVHTVSGGSIVGGAVLIEGEKIVAVGADIEIPEGAVWVDTDGMHVYPGLIEAHSQLGLVEVNSVPGSVDHREVGNLNPNVRAEVAVNPDSERIPVARASGILVAHVVPTGGTISGTSAVMQLDGWTFEEMTLSTPAGLHVRWPGMQVAHNDPKVASDRKAARDRVLRRIEEAFEHARAYQISRRSDRDHPVDLKWEAMLPALNRDVPVFVHADEYRQIEAAVDWAVSEDLRIVIVGGRDAWRSVDRLKAQDIPVIIQGTYRMPRRRWEPYFTPFTTASRLRSAGVRFCIASGLEGPQPERNLPYQAAMAAAFGLPKEEALKSITLYAAEILGVADRVGSIEAGKDATLIVTDGDPLEIRTDVKRAYVQGREVDLTSRHTMLYEKYRVKYVRMGVIE